MASLIEMEIRHCISLRLNKIITTMQLWKLSLFSSCIILLLTNCTEVKNITQKIINKTERERYESALENSPLGKTAMAQEWLRMGRKALRDSVNLNTPFREKFYFRRDKIEAISYRISLQEGEIATFKIKKSNRDKAQVFMDLHYVFPLTKETEQIEVTDSTQQIQYEVEETGEYLLRLQPELLVDCAVEFSVIISPVLSFPVQGHGNSDIGSRWGAPRDGGRRKHKGIDIFAPRGTPLLAATNGVISSVRNRGLGGKQVWLQDVERGQSLYYAHLDSQMVTKGQRVVIGDTLGTVGNTGNARNTPPHLHFGIYKWQGGAVDPEPFVALQSTDLPKITADEKLLNTYARTTTNAQFRTAATTKADLIQNVSRHTALQVLGATGNWYRVQLFDGTQGYIYRTLITDLQRSIQRMNIAEKVFVKAAPRLMAAEIGEIEEGSRVEVFAKTGGFVLVRFGEDDLGWLRIS